MTETIPQTPETAERLSEVLMAHHAVQAVDVIHDPYDDLEDSPQTTWLEVWSRTTTVPQCVIRELSRSGGRFELYRVDHLNGHIKCEIMVMDR